MTRNRLEGYILNRKCVAGYINGRKKYCQVVLVKLGWVDD